MAAIIIADRMVNTCIKGQEKIGQHKIPRNCVPANSREKKRELKTPSDVLERGYN